VAGFGLGTARWGVCFGGFFLFFTNFVAIILSTCIVFRYYGFKPQPTDEDGAALRKRLVLLGLILVVISIPLVFTLHQSIAEVRLRNSINDALRKEVDKPRHSSLVSFKYTELQDNAIEISAVVNTTEYMRQKEVQQIEASLAHSLGRKASLYLEQVKVQPGGLKEKIKQQIVPAIAPPKPPWEVIGNSRDNLLTVVGKSVEKVEKIIAPSKIDDFSVGFSNHKTDISVLLKIRRDSPLTDSEVLWIRRIIGNELNLPVDLKVETVPFVPLLVFENGNAHLGEDIKERLLNLRDVSKASPDVTVVVKSSPGRKREPHELTRQRLESIVNLLVSECHIPRDHINLSTERTASRTPTVKITVIQNGEKPKGE